LWFLHLGGGKNGRRRQTDHYFDLGSGKKTDLGSRQDIGGRERKTWRHKEGKMGRTRSDLETRTKKEEERREKGENDFFAAIEGGEPLGRWSALNGEERREGERPGISFGRKEG